MKNLIVAVSFLFSFSFVYSKTLEICANCKLKTLSEAIKIVQDGDSIFIHKGIYYESDLQIDNSIKISGEKGTIIDGKNIAGVLVINTQNFSLRNIEIQNVAVSYVKDNAAVKISHSENFIIENITLNNVFFGIVIEKSKNGIIRNNIISSLIKNEASSGNGIHAWHSSELKIYNNEVYHMRDGIYFEFVDKSFVYNNYSHNNMRYGLHFMFSNNDKYYNNTFEKNGAGVAVMFSKFIDMYSNKFIYNWGTASYGLLLKEIYDANIYKNTFEENTVGINIEGSTRINYTNNIFKSNGWAIKVMGACYQNNFTKNDFLLNALDVSYNSKLNDNKFENNHWSEYSGYDLDKNGKGDIPYRPVKLYSYVVNESPEALVLLRSLFIDIINFSEKVSPIFTPDNLVDNKPILKPINDFN